MTKKDKIGKIVEKNIAAMLESHMQDMRMVLQATTNEEGQEKFDEACKLLYKYKDELHEQLCDLYDNAFTEEEVNVSYEFTFSSAARKMYSKELMDEARRIGQNWGQELQKRIQELN